MFVDRAIIRVKGGHGGRGCVAFRREKYIPKGGPCGGDGGAGGSVILASDDGLNTLLDFRGRPDWAAADGEPGQGSQCTGHDGADRVVRLPPGTLVYDDATGELIHDMKPGDRVVAARGGRGGRGNEFFKSSTNRTPRHAQAGESGEGRTLRLELKLIADVGLVGLPNAGKSTLLAALTRATPKIADYPFTTLSPQLGIAELDAERRLVIADIPGLIEGASRGAGLGHDFLRHIERTRVLVHLLDVASADGSEPAENYRTVRRELEAYSPMLAEKPEIIALNKMDLLGDEGAWREAVARLAAALGRASGEAHPRLEAPLAISGSAHQGTRELLERAWRLVQHAKTEVAAGSTADASGLRPEAAAVVAGGGSAPPETGS